MELSELIPVYRGASAAHWYNVMREYFRDAPEPVDDDAIYDYMYPLASYVAATTFQRWAVSADVDLEPGLQERIDEALSQGLEDGILPDCDYDYNTADRMFDDCSLAEFLGTHAEFTVTSREMAADDYDNPSIWMMGEKFEGSRPEFKESAFDIFVDSFLIQINFVFEFLWEDEEDL